MGLITYLDDLELGALDFFFACPHTRTLRYYQLKHTLAPQATFPLLIRGWVLSPEDTMDPDMGDRSVYVILDYTVYPF